ncbi:MAG: hypothetical protein ACT4RN_16230 [Pseudonocardia sp.]
MTTAAVTPPLASPLAGEIDRFRRAGVHADALALARSVGAHVLRRGRHHLGDGLLTALDAIRRGHGGRDAFLDAQLDAVLARRRGRFRNQSYLALPLVELVRADLGIDHERMSALLMADVVRHELRPAHAPRLDHRTRQARVRHAARFVTTVDRALDVRWLPGPWFALTVLPVSGEHDEYVFIRALQAQEMVFTNLADGIRGATEALRGGDVTAATAAVTDAGEMLGRAGLVFGLVATVRRAAFHAFRRHGEGTGVFRSESYSRFAQECSDHAGREAGAGPAGPDTFARAWRDVRRPGPVADELDRAVAHLEAVHRRWTISRHALAASLLGDGPGHPESLMAVHSSLDDGLFSLDPPTRRPLAA